MRKLVTPIFLAVGILFWGANATVRAFTLPNDMLLIDPEAPERLQFALGKDMTSWYRERWRQLLERNIVNQFLVPEAETERTFIASQQLKQLLGWDPSFTVPSGESFLIHMPLGVLGATSEIEKWSFGALATALPQSEWLKLKLYPFSSSDFITRLTFKQLVDLTNAEVSPIYASPLFVDIVFELQGQSQQEEATYYIATHRLLDVLQLEYKNRKIGDYKIIDLFRDRDLFNGRGEERLASYTISAVYNLYQVPFNHFPEWYRYSLSQIVARDVLLQLKVGDLVNINPDKIGVGALNLDLVLAQSPKKNYTPELRTRLNHSTQDLTLRHVGCQDHCVNLEASNSLYTKHVFRGGSGEYVIDRSVAVLGGMSPQLASINSAPEFNNPLTGTREEYSGIKLFEQNNFLSFVENAGFVNPNNRNYSLLSVKLVPQINPRNSTFNLDWYYQLGFLSRDGRLYLTPHQYRYKNVITNGRERSILLYPLFGQGAVIDAVPQLSNLNISNLPFCDAPLRNLVQIVNQSRQTSGGLEALYSFLSIFYNRKKSEYQSGSSSLDPDQVDYCRLIKMSFSGSFEIPIIYRPFSYTNSPRIGKMVISAEGDHALIRSINGVPTNVKLYFNPPDIKVTKDNLMILLGGQANNLSYIGSGSGYFSRSWVGVNTYHFCPLPNELSYIHYMEAVFKNRILDNYYKPLDTSMIPGPDALYYLDYHEKIKFSDSITEVSPINLRRIDCN